MGGGRREQRKEKHCRQWKELGCYCLLERLAKIHHCLRRWSVERSWGHKHSNILLPPKIRLNSQGTSHSLSKIIRCRPNQYAHCFFSPPSRERQWCVGMPDLGVNQNMIFSRRIPCFPLPLPLPTAPLPPSPSVSSVWLEDKMPKRGYRIRTQFQSFNSKKAIELSKWTPNLLVVLRGSLTRRCLLSQHLTAFPSPRSSEKKMSSIKKLSSYILFL